MTHIGEILSAILLVFVQSGEGVGSAPSPQAEAPNPAPAEVTSSETACVLRQAARSSDVEAWVVAGDTKIAGGFMVHVIDENANHFRKRERKDVMPGQERAVMLIREAAGIRSATMILDGKDVPCVVE